MCGMPLAEDALRFVEAARGPDHEHAVVQGQLDEVCHDRPIVEDQRVAGVVRRHGPDAVRHLIPHLGEPAGPILSRGASPFDHPAAATRTARHGSGRQA